MVKMKNIMEWLCLWQ